MLTQHVLDALNDGRLQQQCALAAPANEFASVKEYGLLLGDALVEDNRLNAAAGMQGKAYEKYVKVTDGSIGHENGATVVRGRVEKFPSTSSAFHGMFVAVRKSGEHGALICAAFCTSATKERVLLKGIPPDRVSDVQAAACTPSGLHVVPTHRVQFQVDDLEALHAFADMQDRPPVLPYLLRPRVPQGGGPTTTHVAADTFNAEQLAAVRMVEAHAAGGIVAIQGPPGTGKSHVIARGLLSPAMGPLLGRILVVCNSNQGLDSVLDKLNKTKPDAHSWACRIGHDEKVNELLKSYYRGDVEADVTGFRVVFTVGYQAGRLKGKKVDGVAPELPPRNFDTVIYDEASRAGESDIAKVVLANRTTLRLIVLVGDQEQLPPIVHEAMQATGFGRSCMERILVARAASPTHIMLKEQHRMAPQISAIVSELSYRGELRCGPTVRGPDVNGALRGRSLIGINLLPPFAEEDQFVGSARSFVNRAEAKAAHALWRWLERHGDALGVGGLCMAEQCAIITNHLEQRAELQALIGNVPRDQIASPGRSGSVKHPPEIKMLLDTVDTVDAYQGSERDVVVLSPLATKRAGDRRLLNVGLSRAKRLVVIVGALDTLAAGEHGEMGWRQLVQHVREHGVLLDVCQPNMADLTGQLEQIVQAANGVGSQATVVADSSQEAGSVTPTRNVRQRTG